MEKIKRNFGFGCMRLPMLGEEVDIEQVKRMVDLFLAPMSTRPTAISTEKASWPSANASRAAIRARATC